LTEAEQSVGREELASHSIRANHELIVDLGRAKEAQERITNEMPDLFGLMTLDGRVIKGNLGYANLLEIDDEDIYGTSLKDLFLDESWKIIDHNLVRALNGPVTLELPIDRKSLDTMFHWTFAPFSSISSRRGLLFSFIGKDITILRDFERKLSNIFSVIPLGVLTIDRQKNVEWPYSAYSEILLGRRPLRGMSAEQAIFEYSLPHLTRAQRDGVQIFLGQIGADEQWYDMAKDQFPKEIRVGDPGSKTATSWRGLTYNPIIRDGVVEKVLIVVEDITERVRLRKELAFKISKEDKLAQTIVDLQDTDPMFLASCLEDLDIYLLEIHKLQSQSGSARTICNALHGIKGVARTVNLRSFKEFIHEIESRILEGAPRHDSELTAAMRVDLASVEAEWRDLRRFIAAYKSSTGPESPDVVRSQSHIPALIKKREEIEFIAKRLSSAAPEAMAADFEELLGKIRTIGRIPFSSLEPKISAFFYQTMRKLNKRAKLTCDWSSAEIDKDTGPAACEIFYHLLTNALDHGIEGSEFRADCKKPPEAIVTVRAIVRSDRVDFSVEDDGKGIDTQTLTVKAIAMGVLKPDSKMSETEVWNLALITGMSTAETVSDTSGRGIGLAAVDERVKRLGGNGLRITWSRHGVGTKFEFSIKQ
jgi:PAS domain-containing protein